MDFTQSDCEGIPHQLYTEHDAGKVVILEFIMLNCAPCIVATHAMEALVAPYEATHPGRVVVYSFGFLDSYTCEQLQAWKANNAFSHPIFSTGEEQVSYYGGMGMPTIVVTGTNEHKVFYNGIGYTPAHDAEILAAIDSALLYSPTGIGEGSQKTAFRAYPTVFREELTVESDTPGEYSILKLSDPAGKTVLTAPFPASGTIRLHSASLAPGMYFLQLEGQDGTSPAVKLFRN